MLRHVSNCNVFNHQVIRRQLLGGGLSRVRTHPLSTVRYVVTLRDASKSDPLSLGGGIEVVGHWVRFRLSNGGERDLLLFFFRFFFLVSFERLESVVEFRC